MNEMPIFSNDIEQVIKALREKQSNDNTFTSYLIAFILVLSLIPSLKSNDLKISTLAKDLTKQCQAIPDLNETDCHGSQIINIILIILC